MLHEAKNQDKLQRGETIQQIQETFKTIRSKKQRKPRRQLTHETDSYADETYKSLCPFSGISKLYNHADIILFYTQFI